MDWCPGTFHKRPAVGSIPTPATKYNFYSQFLISNEAPQQQSDWSN